MFTSIAMASDSDLAWLDAHYRAMPPVAAMGIGIAGYDGECLRLHAPLARHVNDKGCAFGGSMASLMTLAGWGLLTLWLRSVDLKAEVFVADSTVTFRQPLYDDLAVEARRAEDASWESAFDALRTRGRARLTVEACVRASDAGIAAASRARVVAIAKG